MGGELPTNRQIEKLRESDKTHKDIYRQEDNERKKIRRKREDSLLSNLQPNPFSLTNDSTSVFLEEKGKTKC